MFRYAYDGLDPDVFLVLIPHTFSIGGTGKKEIFVDFPSLLISLNLKATASSDKLHSGEKQALSQTLD